MRLAHLAREPPETSHATNFAAEAPSGPVAHSIKHEDGERPKSPLKPHRVVGLMTTHDGEHSASARKLRAAVDSVILETLEWDPGRVARALDAVVQRCKAEARYPVDEIDAAAAQLRSELGIKARVN
jgi:hypothetical protein